MKMTAKGYEILRNNYGKLSNGFVNGTEALIQSFNDDGHVSYDEAAYMLATAYHETRATMQPIYEDGSKAYFDKYDTGKLAAQLGNTPEKDGDGYLWRGRGFVQLTGHDNYAKASKELGIDFLSNPDLVLVLKNAANIMILGMREGWFTGRKLSNYINKAGADYVNARRIINGTDKALQIAAHARIFREALSMP